MESRIKSETTVEELSVMLRKKFGKYFNAGEQEHHSKEITKMLLKQLPDVSYTELDREVKTVFDKLTVSVIWPDFLRYLLCRLPGHWVKITNDPGLTRCSQMFLLTDGTVMLQESNGTLWKKLTPDANGSYINGTWSDIAPMNFPKLYYASSVLNDGRVIVCGGEYEGSGTATRGVRCEIYDPRTDTWTNIPSPAGITQIGDAPCCVFPDGRFMLGAINSTQCAIYNPATNSWTSAANKPTTSSEESWVLLPDNTIVTIRANGTRIADKYIIAADTWVSASLTPFLLVETSSSELGAGILLNNGRAFFIGATNNSATYVPPALASDPGSWIAGPTFPNDPNGMSVGAKDAPACLLTNGRVLCAVGPVDGVGGISFHQLISSNLTVQALGVCLTRPIAATSPIEAG